MKEPSLIASTGPEYNESLPTSPSQSNIETVEQTNYFKSLQWSPDGTSIFTSTADNCLETFILPTDLLTPTTKPHILTPYTKTQLPEPSYASVPYPHYNLSSIDTTLLLTSVRDHPTRLTNVLDPTSTIISTYPLINTTTEAYETPHSLLFSPSGSTFYTGTTSQISLFDISYNGVGPTHTFPTIPSRRHKAKGGGVGMRGIVSTLALQPYADENGGGMLAAGTWTRWIGLYDSAGMGGTVANWDISSAADCDAKIGGRGVSQVEWSRCGRYLIVAERWSRGCLVFDVRVTGRLCGWLEGRRAETNQRMGVEMFEGEAGCELWAGGLDGSVSVWEGVGMSEGAMRPSWWWTGHSDAVGGIGLHACGGIIATCSGQRHEMDEMTEDESENESENENDGSSISSSSSSSASDQRSLCEKLSIDNSLKVWSLYDTGNTDEEDMAEDTT